jgi:hypothetical protein
MTEFATFVSIASLILTIVLIVKFLSLCKNVKTITDKLNDRQISVDDLIYLSKTNDPSFGEKLQRRIYLDLYNTISGDSDLSFEFVYELWQKRCEYYKWEFPALFAEVKTSNDFKSFLHECSDVN